MLHQALPVDFGPDLQLSSDQDSWDEEEEEKISLDSFVSTNDLVDLFL